MEHKYVQIDKDGTVECTECGIRNSDPTAYFPENIMCDSITRIELLATMEEILKQADHWGLRWEVQTTMVKMMMDDPTLMVEEALAGAARDWDVC